MIRRSLLALATCSVMGPGMAQAQDLGPAGYRAAPLAARAYNWTGFYAGVQAGYGRDRNSVAGRETGDPTVVELSPYTVDMNPQGFIGGLEAGYNWQAGAFVYGIEADMSYTGINGSGTQNSLFSPFTGSLNGQYIDAKHELSWLATLRGRLGVTPANGLLVYATGGLALGRVEYASLYYVSPTIQFASSDSATQFGWTLGGGVEWALASNWSVKAEYLHYDLGRHTVTYSDASFAAIGASLESEFKTSGDILRAGLNYRFD